MAAEDSAQAVAARVRTMTLEAEGVLSLELEPIDGSIADWAPGAHIDVQLADGPVRQYSLCGDPAGGRYRIAVLLEEHSRGGSKAVHERLRPGDTVTLKGPRNHFALEDAERYLFVAGGIGITPMLPMLRAAQQRGADWHLVYLGSKRERMAFLEELSQFDPGAVTIVPRDEGERADLAAILDAHPEAVIYACGPERMLDALQGLTQDRPDRLHLEYFSAPEVEYEPGGAFAIRLARTGVELPVEPEQSVLEVMRSAGVEVLTDCEEGICGSCETRIIAGEAEHRDFVLTSQEREKQDCMMVCVSRAACPLLVLDA